jgi:hypothetical protein
VVQPSGAGELARGGATPFANATIAASRVAALAISVRDPINSKPGLRLLGVLAVTPKTIDQMF